MRSKFGGKGDEEEDEDDMAKKEMEEHDRRAKHSIEGILGDRCEWAAPVIVADVEVEKGLALTSAGGYLFTHQEPPHPPTPPDASEPSGGFSSVRYHLTQFIWEF